MSRLRWRAAARGLLAAGVLVCATTAFTGSGGTAAGSGGNRGNGITADSRIAAAAAAGPVTKSVTATRTFVDANGKASVVARNHVTVTVSQTQNLRSLQLTHVSWTGARPTAGLVADQNSDLAQNEEYPMVLLECRGVNSTKVPAAKQLSPNTCWTQFADERFDSGATAWPAWRSDLDATAAQRRAFVDAPAAKSLPESCSEILFGTVYQRWVPFQAADGTTYPGGPFGCAGQAPEAAPANVSSLALPSNETFGVSDKTGSGDAEFDVFTGEDHASLGCSQTVPCSLVAIPIEGLSCDPSGTTGTAMPHPTGANLTAATQSCEATGSLPVGQTLPAQASGNPAVDGSLWWSPSNWKNRIVIPLNFAPPDDACSLTSGQHPINVFGSELMIQATTQWAPTFCLNSKLFDFNHVQLPEPEARNLLVEGNIEAAFTSDAQDGGYPRPTVNAPTAVTGFGIAFDVDNAQGRPVRVLHLDARLLAKLLTESYPDQPFVKNSYSVTVNKVTSTALQHNPLNITQDPEFQALNPGVPQTVSDAASTLLAISSDSDVMYALTSYINADPEARAWLNGTPDPWGMQVNPNYKGIKLPVDDWPLLDSFEPLAAYKAGANECLAIDPVPYLPLVAAPTSRLFTIGQDMQFAIAQPQTNCVLLNPIPGSSEGAKLTAVGRQPAGHQFMLGIVSLGDAAREGLQLAQLETQAPADPPADPTDMSGRTFVGPTQAGLRAAAAMLTFHPKLGTWPIPYPAMRDDPAGAQAYPGTMVVYTAVPLSGLSGEDAADYADLLDYVATTGQHPGASLGHLPAGYLPMTADNGLANMVTYTQRAAVAVGAQQGTLQPKQTAPTSGAPTSGPPTSGPPTSGPPTSGPPTSGPPTSPGNGAPTQSPGGPGTSPPVTNPPVSEPPVEPTASVTPPPAPSGSPTPSGSPPASSAAPAPASGAPVPLSISATPVAAITPSDGSGVSGALLPIVLGGAVVAIAGAVVVRVRSRRS